ncbi:hypothetical protein LIER_32157 [Lithospermum erythrorhizon]
MQQSEEIKGTLSNISTLLNKQKEDQRRKRSRGNHMEVNTVRGEEEEDNSPKEKESSMRRWKKFLLCQERRIKPSK